MDKSGTETDVPIRVRTSVVQVQREQPRVRAIIPIAATDRNELQIPFYRLDLFGTFYPATKQSSDFA